MRIEESVFQMQKVHLEKLHSSTVIYDLLTVLSQYSKLFDQNCFRF